MRNKDRLIILGAGGHAKVCAEIAQLTGYEEIIYLDDNDGLSGNDLLLGTVEGQTKDIDKLDGDVFVAIGNSAIRGTLLNELIATNRNVISLIHPNAVVSSYATLGKGVVVMAGAIVNPAAIVDDGSIINTCSSVDHDCHIGSFSHIAVGAHICGTVEIGKSCWIGAGAIITNNNNVTDNVVVGAGAVVTKDIKEPGTYVGVPAKRIK